MQEVINKTAAISVKESPNEAGINKKAIDEAKEKTEAEVKESFKDEDVPMEPVLGNDGLEVGGEG